jgi:hypothetical protein
LIALAARGPSIGPDRAPDDAHWGTIQLQSIFYGSNRSFEGAGRLNGVSRALESGPNDRAGALNGGPSRAGSIAEAEYEQAQTKNEAKKRKQAKLGFLTFARKGCEIELAFFFAYFRGSQKPQQSLPPIHTHPPSPLSPHGSAFLGQEGEVVADFCAEVVGEEHRLVDLALRCVDCMCTYRCQQGRWVDDLCKEGTHSNPTQTDHPKPHTLRVALARRQRHHTCVQIGLEEEGDAEALLPEGREHAVRRGAELAVAPVVVLVGWCGRVGWWMRG